MVRAQKAVALVAALSSLFILRPEILFETGDANLYVHQANAFLNGRVDIGIPHHDVAIFNGRFYVPFPPFPAVVLMPFVALFGIEGTRPVMVAVLLWQRREGQVICFCKVSTSILPC